MIGRDVASRIDGRVASRIDGRVPGGAIPVASSAGIRRRRVGLRSITELDPLAAHETSWTAVAAGAGERSVLDVRRVATRAGAQQRQQEGARPKVQTRPKVSP